MLSTHPLSLFEPGRGGLFVLYGHPEVNSLAQKFLAQPLSHGYSVVVLDAGNLFDPYLISRMAQALGREPREVLSKILVSRSFTCHQTFALVRKAASLNGEAYRMILLLGCLTTFYDEEVSLAERRAILRSTLTLLKGISQKGRKVLVTAADPPVNVRGRFDSLLLHAADRAVRVDLSKDGALSIDLVKGIMKHG